jgi:hypothetical protein
MLAGACVGFVSRTRRNSPSPFLGPPGAEIGPAEREAHLDVPGFPVDELPEVLVLTGQERFVRLLARQRGQTERALVVD